MKIRKDRNLLADAIARGVKTVAELADYLRTLESAAGIIPRNAQE